MALLLRPTEISLLIGRGTPAKPFPTIGSRKNIRMSVCSVKDGNFGRTPFKFKGKGDYYANTGQAIRTLREEFPDLFYRELSFDIYRDDIVFRDPMNAFAGINNYKSIFWGLRFHGRMFFTALWVDIVSVSQPIENTIMIRWIVHGIARVPWESRSRFDCISEYKLDKDGKIYEHKVHNIGLNGPQKPHSLALEQLIQLNFGSFVVD